MNARDEHLNEVAIIGMQARLPGAPDLEALLELLREGRESVRFLSEEELRAAGVPERVRRSPRFVNAVSSVPGIDLFDAGFFGFSPKEAEVTDPGLRLFLECAWAALEDAGYDPQTFPGPIGVCAGASVSGYLREHVYPNRELVASLGGIQIEIANALDSLAALVSYKLNLTGPSFTVQTACSTSLVAVHLACQSLLGGECEMALAGGVSVRVGPQAGYLHQEGGILSRDGHTRAFDAKASGTVVGSGVGIVVLKRMADALADGDTIHAVILGSAINNDGSAKAGYTAPSVTGHARVVTEALAVARVSPDTIGYIEAHGTGTVLGDPIEIEGLTRAFREGTQRKGFCALGSLKSNLGHLDHAAGIASLIKAVLTLKYRQIPPSLHFEEPNPKIEFAESPFYVNTRLVEWAAGPSPRRAGVSSLGIGGTNAHAILEEAPERPRAAAPRGPEVLVLSARSEAALEEATDRLARHLRSHAELDLGDVAFTLQVGRQRFSCRRAVVCADLEEASRALQARDPDRVFTALLQPASAPCAFLFPGQGAQHPRMAEGLYRRHVVFRRELDACCGQLRAHLGLDLRELLFPGPERAASAARELDETRLAQPALFVVEYALARLWMAWGLSPQAMIGHSVGEYVAACLAGVLRLEDALALVALRGRLMQELPRGAMLAVPMPAPELEALLPPELALAAVNAPSSCVVSGPEAAIETLARELLRHGTETRRLRTSHAFHSPMMDPALEPFAEAVGRVPLGAPRLRYASNVTGDWITEAQARDPRYWARHLRETVRFAAGLSRILEEPDLALLEVGPGQALGGFVRQHPARGARHTALASLPRAEETGDGERFFLGTVGRLWLSGARPDWRALHAEGNPRRVPLPTYPFERQRYWVARPAAAEPATGRAGPLEKEADVGGWLYSPAWRASAVPLATAASSARSPLRWLVLGRREGLAARIASRLRQSGHDVVEARVGADPGAGGDVLFVDPRRPDDYRRMITRLAEGGSMPRRVLHLWTLSPDAPDAGAPEDIELWQELGFHSLRQLVRALGENRLGELQVRVVSNGLAALAGGDSLQPAKATLMGAGLVIRQEHPQIAFGAIDVACPEPGSAAEELLREQLGQELERAEVEPLVAYRGALRFTPDYEPMPRMGAPSGLATRLRPEGVYLITGGLGRVGLALAEHLVRQARAKLVLTGRFGLPPRETWGEVLARGEAEGALRRRIRAVQALEALGGEVLVLQADVVDQARMAEVVARARARFGAIHGIVHAAGILDAEAWRPLVDLSWEECERQFLPKVQGVEALARVLAGEKPDFVLLMSSLSAVLGGIGYGAYAAANLFMDAFVEAQHLRGGHAWISVNWDAWQTEGAPAAGTPGAERARLAMTPTEAGQALDRILGFGRASRVVVSTADLSARIARGGRPQAPAGRASAAGEAAAQRHPRPNLHSAYVAPESPIEKKVAEIWSEVLGIDRVGRHDNFFELGGTSLLAIQMVAKLRAVFDVELPVATVFEGPTVHSLSHLIVVGAAQGGALVPAGPPGRD